MVETAMAVFGPDDQPVCDEWEVMQSLLPFAGATVLELGCGAAARTRQIARTTDVAHIVAAEVDDAAHQKNAGQPLDKVTFEQFGAEKILAPDASFDIVIMLKSLHHVPGMLMEQAFKEIHRVLKPGGLVYVSEPVFDGVLNEVMRLFNDEERVRLAAFEALREAIEGGGFVLEREVFFCNPVVMQSFDQFREGVLGITHTRFSVTQEVLSKAEQRFESAASGGGEYRFESPNRIDLLRKVG